MPVKSNVDPRQRCPVKVSRHVDDNFIRVFDPESRSTQLFKKKSVKKELLAALATARTVQGIATLSTDGRWCRIELAPSP